MSDVETDAQVVESALERLRAYAPGPELSNPNVWTATKGKEAFARILAELRALKAERDAALALVDDTLKVLGTETR